MMKKLFACALLVAGAHANGGTMDLTGAQVSIKDSMTLSVIGAAGSGGRAEQRFRWDPSSDSFVRTGTKDTAYCSTGAFRDAGTSDGAFSLSFSSSRIDKSMTVTLERIQGFANFPVGVAGVTLYQGKKWFRLEETAGVQGNSLYAKRIEPTSSGWLVLPVGGRAVYRIEGVPPSLDLGAPLTAVVTKDALRYECKEISE
ncbi:hypothetical protein [Roseateles sp.]|uniref:hypothetical protein n=1 Tax=Roseateles sp. TaxID=1971397 RepID=UPI003BA5368A